MSIGSCTCIVKRNGKIEAHIIQGWLFDYLIIEGAVENDQTVFELFAEGVESWKKPERENMTDEEIEILVSLSGCSDDKNSLGYVAGDRYFLVDYEQKKVFTPRYVEVAKGKWRRSKGDWKELSVENGDER